MRKYVTIAMLSAGLLACRSANAQSWGLYIGNGGTPAHYRDDDDDDDNDGLARSICSGQRAHGLEDRLRHEVDENEIGDDEADRIHGVIDRLEDKQRHECEEGDRRAIGEIAYRYDRIAQWIDSEAHGDRRQGW